MLKTKRKHEVLLHIDVARAREQFPFIQQNDHITLLDREEKGDIYSLCDGNKGSFCCFWDRCPIEGYIVKLPVRKIYRSDPTSYKSNINGNTYTLCDTLNATEFYYETDGHFCSVECCMAFLDEEELRNSLYVNSKYLITSITGTEPQRAPHWRVLVAFGGTMTIQEFRASFANRNYKLDEAASGVYPYHYRFKEAFHL